MRSLVFIVLASAVAASAQAEPPVAQKDAGPTAAPSADSTGSRPVPSRTPPPPRWFAKPETTDGSLGISFEELAFAALPETDVKPEALPEKVRGLLNRRVAIVGFMHPTSVLTETGVKRFVLVHDDQMTSWSRRHMLDKSIVVELLPDRTTDFSVRPLVVVGKLTFKSLLDPDGKPYCIYRLDAESVTLRRPAAK